MAPDPRDWLEKRPTASWALVIGYSLLIFFLSSMSRPPQPIDPGNELAFKALTTAEHTIEYAILGFLLAAAYRSLGEPFKRRAFILAAAAGIIYAITDELHQAYVPGRDASIIDLAADTLGVLAGAYVETRKQ